MWSITYLLGHHNEQLIVNIWMHTIMISVMYEEILIFIVVVQKFRQTSLPCIIVPPRAGQLFNYDYWSRNFRSIYSDQLWALFTRSNMAEMCMTTNFFSNHGPQNSIRRLPLLTYWQRFKIYKTHQLFTFIQYSIISTFCFEYAEKYLQHEASSKLLFYLFKEVGGSLTQYSHSLSTYIIVYLLTHQYSIYFILIIGNEQSLL